MAEVEYIIEMVKKGRRSNCHVQEWFSNEALAVEFLAWYYSGLPFSVGPLYLGFIPMRENLEGFPQMPAGTPRDRYRVPDWVDPNNPDDIPVHRWTHPIDYRNSVEGQKMRATYGFKRLYFEQTHHYFGYLKVAYYYGGDFAQAINIMGEIHHMAATHEDLMVNWGRRNYDIWYRWNYWESVRDIHLVDQAGKHASTIRNDGIDVLPDILRTWCAESEDDVWSLETETSAYYYKWLPMQYWPEIALAGWPEE